MKFRVQIFAADIKAKIMALVVSVKRSVGLRRMES